MNRLSLVLPIAALSIVLAGAPVLADTPEVIAAKANRLDHAWSISVTLSHPDTGWDHYANAWQVLAPDDSVLGTRTLTHPHVEEQPFTRSIDHVVIPEGFDHVLIRVRCNLDGWSPRLIWLELPR
ncbi:hypothetical protein [Defluviimonas sp. WL0002]|nr:hypothetical protein [Defluviimonas sp. WL0002]